MKIQNHYLKLNLVLFLLLGLSSLGSIQAQIRTITGVVTSKEGEPLIGATVIANRDAGVPLARIHPVHYSYDP